MSRTTLFVASALALTVTPAFAQVVVTSRPVVTYYAPAAVPAPVVSYETPVYSSRVVYDAPVVVRRPVTTYYAPVSESVTVSSYVVPTTTYYTPVTTYYGGTVVTPAYVSPSYVSPVVVGRSAYGTLRPYVPGQPVLNTLRFAVP